MDAIDLKQILELPVEERLRLLEALWESLASDPGSLPLTEAQKVEIDRRIRAYEANPDAGRSWEEVLASLDK